MQVVWNYLSYYEVVVQCLSLDFRLLMNKFYMIKLKDTFEKTNVRHLIRASGVSGEDDSRAGWDPSLLGRVLAAVLPAEQDYLRLMLQIGRPIVWGKKN